MGLDRMVERTGRGCIYISCGNLLACGFWGVAFGSFRCCVRKIGNHFIKGYWAQVRTFLRQSILLYIKWIQKRLYHRYHDFFQFELGVVSMFLIYLIYI